MLSPERGNPKVSGISWKHLDPVSERDVSLFWRRQATTLAGMCCWRLHLHNRAPDGARCEALKLEKMSSNAHWQPATSA